MKINYLLSKKRFGNLKISSYISSVMIDKQVKLKTMKEQNPIMTRREFLKWLFGVK